jgi:hypothetical protein
MTCKEFLRSDFNDNGLADLLPEGATGALVCVAIG